MTYRRWTPEEKIRIVLESLNTNVGIAELCRKYGLTPALFYHWREKFIEGGKQALTNSREILGEGPSQRRINASNN